MGAQRAAQTFLVAPVAEVVDRAEAIAIGGKRRIGCLRRDLNGRAVSPSADDLRCERFFVGWVVAGLLFQVSGEFRHVLIQLPHDGEGSAVAQRLSRRAGDGPVLLAIAEHELTWSETPPAPKPNGGAAAPPVPRAGVAPDRRLCKPVRKPEVLARDQGFSRMAEQARRLLVNQRESRAGPLDPIHELLAPSLQLGRLARESSQQHVGLVGSETFLPVLRRVGTNVAEHRGPLGLRHALPEFLWERAKQRFGEPESIQPVIGQSDVQRVRRPTVLVPRLRGRDLRDDLGQPVPSAIGLLHP